ncbi:DUF6086 family protein [Streptomyces sp. NPDC001139]
MKPVWNPSIGAARLFLRHVAVFEAELGLASGFGPMENDQCRMDPAAFQLCVSAPQIQHRTTSRATHPCPRRTTHRGKHVLPATSTRNGGRRDRPPSHLSRVYSASSERRRCEPAMDGVHARSL